MLPTTGRTVEIAVFATLWVTASTLPDINPVMDKNAVNAIISTVIIVTASHFKNPTAEASPSPPSAAFPIPAAMYAHIMGIISRSEQVMRTSINIIDTAYFAPDEV